jgi:hypothetical protein
MMKWTCLWGDLEPRVQPPEVGYRVRARNGPRRVTGHEQHAHHHKDEVIVTATKALLTRFFGGETRNMLTNHLY